MFCPLKTTVLWTSVWSEGLHVKSELKMNYSSGHDTDLQMHKTLGTKYNLMSQSSLIIIK